MNRRRVYIALASEETAVITALRVGLRIDIFTRKTFQPVSFHRWEETAHQLGLHDGYGWNLRALCDWIDDHCLRCWEPLTDPHQRYCSDACKQHVYRRRKQARQAAVAEVRGGLMFMDPENDPHARAAVLNYAKALQADNPVEAQKIRAYIKALDTAKPAKAKKRNKQRSRSKAQRYELPEWLISQVAND